MLKLEDIALLAKLHESALAVNVESFDLKGRTFHSAERNGKPHIMGVVNLSADSWYRESVCLNIDQAVQRGRRLFIEGADLIDVGAESTLLDATRVDEKSQTSMLLPVVKQLAENGVLVSVETYHESVAEACLLEGAVVLNMTRAEDTEVFYKLAAEHEAGVIICYVQGAHVRNVADFTVTDDPIGQLYEYFAREIEKAEKCGLSKLWVDAGLGFYYKNLNDSSKRVNYQIKTFLESFRLRSLGWPVCQALPHAFEYFGEEVRSAEPFFSALATLGKTDLLRTHEVAQVAGVIGTLDCYEK